MSIELQKVNLIFLNFTKFVMTWQILWLLLKQSMINSLEDSLLWDGKIKWEEIKVTKLSFLLLISRKSLNISEMVSVLFTMIKNLDHPLVVCSKKEIFKSFKRTECFIAQQTFQIVLTGKSNSCHARKVGDFWLE